MFCPQCGGNLPDDAQFCGNCGCNVSSGASPQAQQTPNPTIITQPNVPEAKKGFNPALLAIPLIVVIAIAAVFGFGLLNKDTGVSSADSLKKNYGATPIENPYPNKSPDGIVSFLSKYQRIEPTVISSGNANYDEAYDGILEKYGEALLNEWSPAQFDNNGLNYAVTTYAYFGLGYLTEDLNGDGTPELIITVFDDGTPYTDESATLIDLFTFQNGNLLRILSSNATGDDNFYLTDNGYILNEKLALDSKYIVRLFYKIDNDSKALILQEAFGEELINGSFMGDYAEIRNFYTSTDIANPVFISDDTFYTVGNGIVKIVLDSTFIFDAEYWTILDDLDDDDYWEELWGNDAPTDDGNYFLPGSDSRYIDESELYGFTAEECRFARNELYARHGRKFNSEDLQLYFNAQSWYVPTIEADAFSDSMFNEYERANRDLISAYEKKQGYR